MAFYDTIRKLVESRFKDQWSTRTKVKWPNVPFNPPTTEAWVEFAFRWGPERQESFGSTKLTRIGGFVVISVHAPKGLGSKPALQHADFAADILRYWQATESGVTLNFFEAGVGNMVDTPVDFLLNATAHFQADKEL